MRTLLRPLSARSPCLHFPTRPARARQARHARKRPHRRSCRAATAPAPEPPSAQVAAGPTPSRLRVESTIRDRPGITRSELCRRLGLGWGTVGYHVLWLLRERRIYEARSRRRIFLYAATVGEERQLTMRLHWQDTPGRILRELQAAHARGLEDLVRSTGLSHRALRTSLQELVQAGLLERSASYHAKYRLSSPPLAAHATSHQAAIVLGDPSTMIGDP